MPLISTIGAGAARGLGFTSGQKKYNIDFLLVAGGGGGGGVATGWTYGGGAGGGGMRKFTSQEILGGKHTTQLEMEEQELTHLLVLLRAWQEISQDLLKL